MEAMVILFIILGIAFFVFLFCREILCWYFKTNRCVELLEQILIELQKQNPKP